MAVERLEGVAESAWPVPSSATGGMGAVQAGSSAKAGESDTATNAAAKPNLKFMGDPFFPGFLANAVALTGSKHIH